MKRKRFKEFLVEMITYHDTVHSNECEEDIEKKETDDIDNADDAEETKKPDKLPLKKSKYHHNNLRKYLQHNNTNQ